MQRRPSEPRSHQRLFDRGDTNALLYIAYNKTQVVFSYALQSLPSFDLWPIFTKTIDYIQYANKKDIKRIALLLHTHTLHTQTPTNHVEADE